jgi:hypothetical protein
LQNDCGQAAPAREHFGAALVEDVNERAPCEQIGAAIECVRGVVEARDSSLQGSEGPSMGKDIRESDWKVFREIHPAVLARFCDRILSEVTRLANDCSTSSHERYLLIFDLIQQRNADIATAFDDFRRSTAIRQLAIMHSRELLSNEELARFSSETQDSVKSLSEIYGTIKKPDPQ